MNRVIFLDPPMEYARSSCTLPCLGLKLKLSMLDKRYLQIEENPEFLVRDWATETYTSLLTRFTDNTLERPFAVIEHLIVHNLGDDLYGK